MWGEGLAHFLFHLVLPFWTFTDFLYHDICWWRVSSFLVPLLIEFCVNLYSMDSLKGKIYLKFLINIGIFFFGFLHSNTFNHSCSHWLSWFQLTKVQEVFVRLLCTYSSTLPVKHSIGLLNLMIWALIKPKYVKEDPWLWFYHILNCMVWLLMSSYLFFLNIEQL